MSTHAMFAIIKQLMEPDGFARLLEPCKDLRTRAPFGQDMHSSVRTRSHVSIRPAGTCPPLPCVHILRSQMHHHACSRGEDCQPPGSDKIKRILQDICTLVQQCLTTEPTCIGSLQWICGIACLHHRYSRCPLPLCEHKISHLFTALQSVDSLWKISTYQTPYLFLSAQLPESSVLAMCPLDNVQDAKGCLE
jgi:hypothetical protein